MSLSFSDEEIKEFTIEAKDLLDEAETGLLALEAKASLSQYFDAIFRVFHSLKGGAGMLGLTDLQAHMHALENFFSKLKNSTQLSRQQCQILLSATDAARSLLDGHSPQFDLQQLELPDLPPALEPSSPNSLGPSSLPPKKTTSGVSALIYAIDDEPAILEVIKEHLELSGLHCKTFEKLEDLIAAIRQSPPDVVLTDMKMPQITGVDVLKQVKAIDPDLPVIFVSGYLDKSVLLESIRLGVFSAIEKPFDEKNLISQVIHAARQREITKMLNRSINLILYQFTDLDQFLQQSGKEDIRRSIRKELELLMEQRKKLRSPRSTSPNN